MLARFSRKLTLADLAPFPDAVAGHEGVLSDTNHDFVIKPCTDQEVTFYEECSRRHCELKTMMPLYYGTLALTAPDLKQVLEQHHGAGSSTADAPPQLQAGTHTPLPAKARGRMLETNRAIVLENLTLPFERPNIMDIKLGIRLWADDATPEKRRKLDAVSAETTSGSLGFRVAGMKVWDPVATAGMQNGYRVFDKMYGRTFDERTIRTPFQEFFYERSADGSKL
jgi:1D-myo-inositol-tetrakisphosphate 5-kinase/inositol-polyphosphate multikinase